MTEGNTNTKEMTMAGWKRYNEYTGEVETGLYEHPFIVRGTPKKLGIWDVPEDITIASFRTKEEAVEWLRRNEVNYKQGESGFASFHIENWNQ